AQCVLAVDRPLPMRVRCTRHPISDAVLPPAQEWLEQRWSENPVVPRRWRSPTCGESTGVGRLCQQLSRYELADGLSLPRRSLVVPARARSLAVAPLTRPWILMLRLV